MGPIFLFLIVAAVLIGMAGGRMEEVTEAALGAAKSSVIDVALPLIGVMALFLGLAEVVQQGGLMRAIARGLRPLFRRLFPEVPSDHPAIGMMTLNISANMLGLGNAATPFGIEAMRKLDRLNATKGTTTDAMCLFLAINTSGVALLPSGVIGIRASLESADPAAIIVTSLMATSFSTVVAIFAALVLARLPIFRAMRPELAVDEGSDAAEQVEATPAESEPPEGRDEPRWHRGRAFAAAGLFLAALAGGAWSLSRMAREMGAGEAARYGVSWALMPLVILAAVLYGWSRGVKVYAALTHGAREGFKVAVLIIPYLVAILVAVGMFRASGALDIVIGLLAPITEAVGFPAEALPMALTRPLSGSGAMGVMTETMQTYGPDSYVGYLVSTLNGSTETTFYVLAVYGGAVGLRRTRHAMPACLIGDLAGAVGATAACWLVFG
ncbi:MAG: spore maturation protein [Acidobacteriota bacterium]|nr:MAG: spore maturation protein [Acidobacteriota bacterium]